MQRQSTKSLRLSGLNIQVTNEDTFSNKHIEPRGKSANSGSKERQVGNRGSNSALRQPSIEPISRVDRQKNDSQKDLPQNFVKDKQLFTKADTESIISSGYVRENGTVKAPRHPLDRQAALTASYNVQMAHREKLLRGIIKTIEESKLPLELRNDVNVEEKFHQLDT